MEILAFCLSQPITAQLCVAVLQLAERWAECLKCCCTTVRPCDGKKPYVLGLILPSPLTMSFLSSADSWGPLTWAQHAGLSIIRYFLPFIGNTVCVQCNDKAQRDHLGGRCQGHGTDSKRTRFKNILTPKCHGKWTRLEITDDCPCKDGPDFVFV